ncbi:MAG UNVERIFIED_CONTAM: hypothetical protein LVR29_14800 [Microcystis novacekii LVE1205-3]|jgi:predicted XRE-type DNA-binding protein
MVIFSLILAYPEAEHSFSPTAQILSRIIDIVNERNFTEAETAETLGISKLEASQLIKGKTESIFSGRFVSYSQRS